MISILLIKKIVELFLIILFGFILTKTHVLRAEDGVPVSKILLYLIMPCCILSTFQITLTKEVLQGIAFAAVTAAAAQFLLIVFGRILGRPLRLSLVERKSVSYPSTGNLIFPIVQYVFGNEYVIYVTVFFAVQLLFCWTHLVTQFSGERQIDLKKILLNVNVIAIAAGVVLLITSVRLPGIAGSAVSSVGNMIGPLSMLAVGITMADVDLKKMFTDARVYLTAALRLLICPLFILLLFRAFRIFMLVPDGGQITSIMLLETCTPSAAIIVQFSLLYGKDYEHASVINVMSTILCIATMPCILGLYTHLLG